MKQEYKNILEMLKYHISPSTLKVISEAFKKATKYDNLTKNQN